jgi:O-antigen ligase
VTPPSIPAEAAPRVASSWAERTLAVTTTLLLLAAPVAASAGLRATCLIVSGLAIIAWSPWKSSTRYIPWSIAGWVAAWALVALASLAWSEKPSFTAAELRAEVFYDVLAFTVFFLAARDVRAWKRWLAALVIGSLVALAGKLVTIEWGPILGRHSPYGGAGAFSTHLVLVAAFMPALVFAAPWGWGRGAAALALGLAALFAAAWVTSNRVVWLCFILMTVVAFSASRRVARPPPHDARRLRLVVVAGVVAMATAFLFSVAEKNDRFFPEGPRFAPSIEKDIRPALWREGWHRFLDAPWLGHGFGRDILEEAFLPLTPRGVNHPELRHGHNVLLNVALQLGIVGLAVFIALLFALAREYAAWLSQPAIAPLGVIGLALLCGFIAKNLTDDFFHRHNGLVFWALNGMLLGFGRAFARR